MILNFFKNADDEDRFHVQWYGRENEFICGHVETSESDDGCVKCQGNYNECEEWLCCTVCRQWYHEEWFFMTNLSHLVLILDLIVKM